MLRLCRSIAIGGYIVANELKALGEDETLLEAEGMTVCLAYAQLTFHVKESNVKCGSVIDDVVNNDASVGFVAQGDTH